MSILSLNKWEKECGVDLMGFRGGVGVLGESFIAQSFSPPPRERNFEGSRCLGRFADSRNRLRVCCFISRKSFGEPSVSFPDNFDSLYSKFYCVNSNNCQKLFPRRLLRNSTYMNSSRENLTKIRQSSKASKLFKFFKVLFSFLTSIVKLFVKNAAHCKNQFQRKFKQKLNHKFKKDR